MSIASTFNLPTDPALHPDESGGAITCRGVTRILRDCGLMSDWQVADSILERGNDVHKATQYYDESDLDLRTPPKEYRARVRAWAKFKSDTNFKIELIETQVQNVIFGFRGRLDRVGVFGDQKMRAVVDIKTGKPQAFTRLQTAAYGTGLNPKELFRRIAVELRADGTFWLDEYPIAEYYDDVNT